MAKRGSHSKKSKRHSGRGKKHEALMGRKVGRKHKRGHKRKK